MRVGGAIEVFSSCRTSRGSSAVRSDDGGAVQANSLDYCRGCERRYWFGALTVAPSCAAACQRDEIGLARADDRLGLFSLGDQADGHGGDARGLLHGARQRHLIARAERDLLLCREPAAGHVDEVGAARLGCRGEGDALLDIPATLDPVRAGDAEADGIARRHHGPHRIEHREREAHPVLQRAAIFVLALVRERREELVHQIAMSAMQLDRGEAEPYGPAGRVREGLDQARDVIVGEGARRPRVGLEADLRGRFDRPAALIEAELAAALPGLRDGGLAAGMGELDRDRHVRPAARCIQSLAERGFGFIRPESEIERADPAIRLDGRRFDDQEAGAGQGEMSEMDGVPVGGAAFLRRILAHRGDDDPVGKREAAKLIGAEELAHGGTGSRKGQVSRTV